MVVAECIKRVLVELELRKIVLVFGETGSKRTNSEVLDAVIYLPEPCFLAYHVRE